MAALIAVDAREALVQVAEQAPWILGIVPQAYPRSFDRPGPKSD